VLFAVAAGLIFAAVAFMPGFSLREVSDTLNRLSLWALFPLVLVLPLVGFSISVVYLVIGLRFGPAVGLMCVAVLSFFHVLLSHLLVRGTLRRPVEAWLERHRDRIPALPTGEERHLVALVVLAPVLPYTLRLYVLALSGISLRTCLAVSVPLFTVRSAVTLFIGDLGANPSPRAAAVLVGIYLAKLALCAWLAWHIRERYRRQVSDGQGSPLASRSR